MFGHAPLAKTPFAALKIGRPRAKFAQILTRATQHARLKTKDTHKAAVVIRP